VIKDIAVSWNRSKVKAFTRGLIGATVIFTVLFLGYIGLSKWNSICVPTDVAKISEVSVLADVRIAYHIEYKDHISSKSISNDIGFNILSIY